VKKLGDHTRNEADDNCPKDAHENLLPYGHGSTLIVPNGCKPDAEPDQGAAAAGRILRLSEMGLVSGA
jgi:hypothetical protein